MDNLKQYIWGAALLAAFVSCSKEPDGKPVPDAQVPISVTATLSGQDHAAAPTADAPTKAVADPTQNLTLYFARCDQNASGVYDAYGTAPIQAIRTAGEGAQALTFSPTQYYPVPGRSVKMTGWYPKSDSFTGDVVSWTLDGTQDVMTAPAAAGSLTAARMSFAFAHRLVQLRFLPFAANAEAQEQWGAITAIEVCSQPNVCTYTLAASDGDGAVAFGAGKGKFGVRNIGAATPLPVGKANAVQLGDPVMVAPQAVPYNVRVTVTTAKNGARSFVAPARTYIAGSVINMKLRFTQDTFSIEPELTVSDWTAGWSVEVKTEPRPEPGVDIDDWGTSGNTEIN